MAENTSTLTRDKAEQIIDDVRKMRYVEKLTLDDALRQIIKLNSLEDKIVYIEAVEIIYADTAKTK